MAYERDSQLRNDELRRRQQLETEFQADPELAEGPASGGRLVLFAIAVIAVLGVVFYGLNNSSTGTSTAQNPPATTTSSTTPAQQNAQTNTMAPSNPNTSPGQTTGAAPASPPPGANPSEPSNSAGSNPANSMTPSPSSPGGNDATK